MIIRPGGMMARTRVKGMPVPSGLVFFMDATDTSTMTLTSFNGYLRVDNWVSKQGSGATNFGVGAFGVGANPKYTSSLFGGKGGIDFFVQNVHMKATAALSGVNAANGFTVMTIKQFPDLTSIRTGYYGMSDGNGNDVFGVGTQFRFGAGSGSALPQGIPVNQAFIHGIAQDPTHQDFIQGGNVLPGATSGFSIAGAWGQSYIMASFAGGTQVAKIQAYLLWNRKLSSAEVAAMAAWLTKKFAVPAYPTPAFNIIVDGNSLAFGLTSTSHWTMADGIANATLAPGPNEWQMAAVGGLTTTNNISRAAANVDAFYSTAVNATRRVVVFWEITNELNASVTAAAAYANVKTYCQARKAIGWKVIVLTCLPRSSGNGTFEADRQTVNTNIKTNAVSEGWADVVADVGGDATIGAAGANLNATYYSDGTHLTDAGHTIGATYVTAALNALMV